MGFSPINPVYLRKPILSARADKVGLSAHADKDCFPGKPTLSARADNMGFLDTPGLSERKPLSADNVGFFFSKKPTLSERNPYYLIR